MKLINKVNLMAIKVKDGKKPVNIVNDVNDILMLS